MDQGEEKPFDWKPSPNMCRCCLSDGCNKDISSTYNFSGEKEVYGEMLKETLDIQISQHHVSLLQQICEECIIQLRNAQAFKQNILWSEATLSQYYNTLQHSDVDMEQGLKPYMKTEPIPEECSDDDHRNDAGMDDVATPDDSELGPQCAFAGDQEPLEICPDTSPLCSETFDHKPTILTDRPTAGRGTGESGDEVFQCDTCSKWFTQKNSLIQHIHSQLASEDKCYTATNEITGITDKGLYDSFNYNDHKKVHIIKTSYSCEVCDKQCDNNNSLKIHMRTHTRYSCDLCDKIFVTKKGFEIHKSVNGDRPHSCKICNIHYSQRDQLDEHLERHTGNYYRFVCDVCKKGFNVKHNFTKHMLIHMGIKPFSCGTCRRQFREKPNLIRHIRLRHKNVFPYTCKTCDMKFITKRLFNTHKRQHAEGTTQYSCELCDKKFETKRGLLTHKKLTGDRPYSCKICNLHYSQRSQLDEHLVRHTRDDYRYVCDVCKKGFNVKSYLIVHMRVHTGAKPYSCRTCKKQFRQKSNLNDHIRQLHKDVFLYACKTCNMEFVDKRLFDTHKLQHAEGTTQYSCELCDKKFETKRGLLTHKKFTDDRPYSCKICNLHYSERGQLDEHLVRHTRDYRYVCDVCKKGFNVKCSLMIHMRVHTGAKPYSCRTCKKQFTQKSNLNNHILRLHKGVFLYSCQTCNMKFVDKRLFDTHKRQHAEETTRYSCELCDKEFETKRRLLTHKKFAGDRPYSCKFCKLHYSQRSQLDEHLVRHTPDDYRFVCDVCKKGFNVKCNLMIHMRVHTGAKPYSCGTCKRQFKQKQHLYNHIQRRHKDVCLFDIHKRQYAEDTARHSCELCDKKFVTKPGLLTHKKITGDRHYSCKIRNIHYSQRCQLDERLGRHTRDQYRFVCDVCKKEFSFRNSLITHMLIHMGIKPYSCGTCKRQFRQKSHLNEHTRRRHENVKIRKPIKEINYCQICKKQFTTKIWLKRHMEMHATGPARKESFCCDKCGKQFKNKTYFMVHFRSHMGIKKSYSCGICNKQFQSSNSLVVHKRVVHSGEKPYPCEICGKRFGQRSTLKAHLFVHSGQRSFSCEVCNKQFIRKSDLTKHRRVHTGERPFLCDLCPKAFRVSAGLIGHRRIHTRDKKTSASQV